MLERIDQMGTILNIKDQVLITETGSRGEIVARAIITHNKAQAGDLLVVYKCIVRGKEEKCSKWFRPSDLERCE